MTRRYAWIFGLLTSVLLLEGCGGGSSGGTDPQPLPPATQAEIVLSRLDFTDGSNWVVRAYAHPAPTSATDTSVAYTELHLARTQGGTPYAWGTGSTAAHGSDLHWNGSAWVSCALNDQHRMTLWDAQNRSDYNLCDGAETGSMQRSATDLSGKSMLATYHDLRNAGHTRLTLADPTLLGTATFTTGSQLYHYNTSGKTTAPWYAPGADQVAWVTNANVASGKGLAGDHDSACGKVNPARPSDYSTSAQTLEDLIAANAGTPCVFAISRLSGTGGATVSSGTRNQWWGNSTLQLGMQGTAPIHNTPTDSYYSGNTLLQVSFGSGITAHFHQCQQRYDGPAWNCTALGDGTYRIEVKGDARVLSFVNVPSEVSALGYSRLLIERGGRVYIGQKDRLTSVNSARLNQTAAAALLGQLGLPDLAQHIPVKLSPASFAGLYNGTVTRSSPAATSTWTLSLSADGSAPVCSGAGSSTCSFSLSSPSGTSTLASISLNFNWGDSANTANSTLDYRSGQLSGSDNGGFAFSATRR